MDSMPKVQDSQAHAAASSEDVRMREIYGSAASGEVCVPSNRADMRKALDGFKCRGTFAKHTYVDREVTGIHVNGVGRINLPLQDNQARQIITHARKAPVDGSDIVDLTIRDTWELLPSQFKLMDRGWPKVIQSLCEEIAVDMGLKSDGIHARLDRMLLYENGSMYKSHVDPLRQNRMVGTLVIRLPADHSGGTVVAEHGGVKKILTTHSTEQDPRAAIWWFRNIAHEVQPVTQGWRWVLRYNLLPYAPLSPAIASDQFTTALARNDLLPEPRFLRDTLQQWLSLSRKERQVDCLYLGLEHDYPENRLVGRELKTHDSRLFDSLNAMTRELPMEIFLAVVQKKEEKECRHLHDIDGFADERPYFCRGEAKYNVVKVADPYDGTQLGSNISVDPDEIIQAEDEFFSRHRITEYGEPDARYLTQVTKRIAIVIVPRDYAVVEYLKPRGRLKPREYDAAACYLNKLCFIQHPFCETQESAASLWHQFCYNFIKPYNGLGEVSHDLIKSLKSLPRHPFPTEIFICALYKVFDSDDVLEHIKDGLLIMLDKIDALAKQCEAIEEFTNYDMDDYVFQCRRDEAFDDKIEQVNALARQAFALVLNARDYYDLTLDDGYNLAEVAIKRFDPTFVETSIVPFFARHCTDFSFSLAFITELHDHRGDVELGPNEVQNLLIKLATTILDELYAPDFRTPGAPEEEILMGEANAENLINFLKVLNTASFPADTVPEFLHEIAQDADEIHKKELRILWLPFLRKLIPFLEEEYTKQPLSRYRDLYVAILDGYLKQCVGFEPRKKFTTSVPLPPVPCSCTVCRRLNRFLKTDLGSTRYSLQDEELNHVRCMLRQAHLACSYSVISVGRDDMVRITKPEHKSRRMQHWEGRVAEAEKELEQFDQVMLRKILGGKYPDIMEMRGIKGTSEEISDWEMW